MRQQLSVEPSTSDQVHPDHLNEAECTDDCSVLFLGTVSMKPSVFRNPSAILLSKNHHYLLMDSAEGTYSQMLDHFQSQERVKEVLS